MNEWTFALILALMFSYWLIVKAIESWKEVQLAKYTTDFDGVEGLGLSHGLIAKFGEEADDAAPMSTPATSTL